MFPGCRLFCAYWLPCRLFRIRLSANSGQIIFLSAVPHSSVCEQPTDCISLDYSVFGWLQTADRLYFSRLFRVRLAANSRHQKQITEIRLRHLNQQGFFCQFLVE
jgi:hypothetical protein